MTTTTIPWFCFDVTSVDTQASTIKIPDETGDLEKMYCCFCQHAITDKSKLILVNGEIIHSRTNPAGINYRFSCFQQAAGCIVNGAKTSEYSWFNSYMWQIALCSNCKEHLGWYFSGASHFFALILDRLITK